MIPNDLHEIHITVKTDDTVGFQTFCDNHGIKAIIIAYEARSDGKDVIDPMTSHHFHGQTGDVLFEVQRVSNLLQDAGFEPIRQKIECTPNNPIIKLPFASGYWESHLGVSVPLDQISQFRSMVNEIHMPDHTTVHVSRNAFKIYDDAQTLMVTHRRDSNFAHDLFVAETEYVSDTITNAGFKVEKMIVEYCWYDTNRQHDDLWMVA